MRRAADYIMSLLTGSKENKVKWCKRSGEDKEMNPIDFMNKYWGEEISFGVFHRSDLKAVDGFCSRRSKYIAVIVAWLPVTIFLHH